MDQTAVCALRANIMKIMKQVERGASLNITSRGRIVAKLVPPHYSCDQERKKLAEIAKNAKIGDVISPIDEEWKANQE
mgnify:CR=1 FL=1